MRRLLLSLLALAAVLVAACGGGDAESGSGDDARKALAAVKPIDSARVDAVLRLSLDIAPADVGDRLELRFAGPLRSNGAGKLPSLDWRIAFAGFDTDFASRLVSTGNNLFVRLGGADFEVGEDAVARLNESGARAGEDGLAALGLDPIERFLRNVPQQAAAGQPAPRLDLTPERRAQVAETFRAPRFEAEVADDRTIRRLLLKTRFATQESSRAAAGGITGGAIEYRLRYTDVGAEVTIPPVRGARPIGEFNAALQRELAK